MIISSFLFMSIIVGIAPEDPNPIKFERVVIDDNFPGGYQVEVADVDGDGKPDIVALGGSTCVWYQNPTWKKRVISTSKETPGIISSATRDLDGDGKAEVAIAFEFSMNQPKNGKILLARQGKSSDDPWTFAPIADLGSVHRLRWGDLDGDKTPELVAAPIFGMSATPPLFQEEGARIRIFTLHKANDKIAFQESIIDHPLHVLHAIDIIERNGEGWSEILTASNAGVVAFAVSKRVIPAISARLAWSITLGTRGASGIAPKCGSSEVHVGKLHGTEPFQATIEPWHGNEVAAFRNAGGNQVREVLDDTLDDGHALWVVDADGDGNDDIFAGHRGKDARVSIYRHDGKIWLKTVLDHDVAAQDLRGGDLDGDKVPDIVAIGGKTKNVVWYRPIRSK